MKQAYGDADKTFKAAVEPNKENPAAPPVAPSPVDQGRKAKIRIGTKEFDTEKEALDYASELEVIRLQEESYKEGVKAATPKPPEPVPESKIKALKDKIFENPEEFLADLEKIIDEQAEKKVKSYDEVKTQAQVQKENTDKFWDGFYKKNGDLGDFSDEVNRILQKEWATLQFLKADDASEQLASLTRSYLDSIKEKRLPSQALPSKQVTTAGGTIPTTATPIQATKETNDFISQVKKHGRRTVE
jgi:hypothetical protein